MTQKDRLLEVPLEDETVFQGRLIRVSHMQVRLPDGRQALREIVHHHGGVAVVPVDSQGRVSMVRQYRAALGDMLLEIPAGKLETPGEDPLSAARRELEEECGLRAEHMQLLTVMVPTPGYCTERLFLYLATGLTPCAAHLDQDEFLAVEAYSLEELVDWVAQGRLGDAKTALGLLLAQRHLAGGAGQEGEPPTQREKNPSCM